jgi:hypothetical protein
MRNRHELGARTAVALAGALISGCLCGVITGEVKPRTVNVEATRTVATGADCGSSPLPTAVVDLGALFKEADLDLTQGCLKSLSFGLVADLVLLPGPGCAAARGTSTLDKLVLSLTCQDGTRSELSVVCPDKSLDFGSQESSYDVLNRCLDLAEAQLVEPLRKAANTCRPTRLEAAVTGTCSADTCVAATVKMGFRLNSAVAQLGGTCP